MGSGTPPENNDSVGLLSFICYCAEMYKQDKEPRYLQMAKDVFAYQWMLTVPVDLAGFTHRTRDLMREQDFYSAFDIPMKINDYAEYLPYLSKETKASFGMNDTYLQQKFYRFY